MTQSLIEISHELISLWTNPNSYVNGNEQACYTDILKIVDEMCSHITSNDDTIIQLIINYLEKILLLK